jgi:uncharacterized protein YggL (DUF469 family)
MKIMTEMGILSKFSVLVLLLAKQGIGHSFPASYFKDSSSWIPKQYGGRGLPYFYGVEAAWKPSVRFTVLNISEKWARHVVSYSDSRKTRGIILDEGDQSFSENLIEKLDLQSFVEDDIRTKLINDTPHSEMSFSAQWTATRADFVDSTFLDIIDKKVKAHDKAFNGPTELTKSQKSFPSRIRAIRRKMIERWEYEGCEQVETESLIARLQSFPQAHTRWIPRALVNEILPSPLIPSLTLNASSLKGEAFLVEMPDPTVHVVNDQFLQSSWCPSELSLGRSSSAWRSDM